MTHSALRDRCCTARLGGPDGCTTPNYIMISASALEKRLAHTHRLVLLCNVEWQRWRSKGRTRIDLYNQAMVFFLCAALTVYVYKMELMGSQSGLDPAQGKGKERDEKTGPMQRDVPSL